MVNAAPSMLTADNDYEKLIKTLSANICLVPTIVADTGVTVEHRLVIQSWQSCQWLYMYLNTHLAFILSL